MGENSNTLKWLIKIKSKLYLLLFHYWMEETILEDSRINCFFFFILSLIFLLWLLFICEKDLKRSTAQWKMYYVIILDSSFHSRFSQKINIENSAIVYWQNNIRVQFPIDRISHVERLKYFHWPKKKRGRKTHHFKTNIASAVRTKPK